MTPTANTWSPSSCGRRSSLCCPPRHAATEAARASTTAPAWPASSTSCAPASPGGCCPPASWAAVARSPAGGGCAIGSAPACSSSCTTSCWTSSAARAGWTGRGPAWTQSACAPSGGRPDRPQPDRPRQARKQVPPAGRPRRHPLAVRLSAANTHDSMLLEQLIDAVAPVRGPRGRPGRPRRRPAKLHLDKGYDYPRCRRALRQRGITPRIARRGVESSQRLGRHRYVAERSLAWLVGYRRLQVRYERCADILLGLVQLACALICLNALQQSKA